MFASDYRTIARQSLSGNWPVAVAAGIIVSILGGIFVPPTHDAYVSVRILSFSIPLRHWLFSFPPVVLACAFITAIVNNMTEVGYAGFNLDLVDRRPVRLGTLMDYISYISTAFCTHLLKVVYIILGAMLFVIPGILALYNYSMTSYILAEYPDISPRDALSRSKELMRGNRWRLFCLDFSFIGWAVLCALTAGIGNLFLTPYYAAAKAAFYRSLTGTSSIHQNIMNF